jgi:hypothetical protein
MACRHKATTGPASAAPTPVGEFLATRLDGLRLGPSTVASYRKNVRLHITPAIGMNPLASLTTARIDKMYLWVPKTYATRRYS